MGLFPQVGFPTLVVLAALGLTIGFLLMRSHRYLARQDKGRSPIVRTPRPEPHGQGPGLDAPDDVMRWEVQMHETARDLSGQLDSKMGALSHLIREADRAAARLEAALKAAGQQTDQDPMSAESTEQPSNSPDRPSRQPANQAEALQAVGAADGDRLSQGTSPEAGPTRPSAERRYEEIYLLADYGFDAAEIARRVGSPVGEVELILGLRQKR